MTTATIALEKSPSPSLRGHVQIARIDHWDKTLFIIPGGVAALALDRISLTLMLLEQAFLGLLAAALVASSNYIINEVMDAPFDRFHPVKHSRPVPSGRVSVPLAYFEWVALGSAGLWLAFIVSFPFMLSLLALWIMGCIYNIPPIRSKDIPYVDVLTEALNNPIRLLAGWFLVSYSTMAPSSLLISYWMAGCYFMALKRYAEYLHLKADNRLAQYRSSLACFTSERLMVSVMFYGCTSMLFFGAFIMRYRMELVLSFPFVAWVMAIYLSLAFKVNSTVEHPEKLYRERKLMFAVACCALVMAVCLRLDMPKLYQIFTPTAPVSRAYAWLQHAIDRK